MSLNLNDIFPLRRRPSNSAVVYPSLSSSLANSRDEAPLPTLAPIPSSSPTPAPTPQSVTENRGSPFHSIVSSARTLNLSNVPTSLSPPRSATSPSVPRLSTSGAPTGGTPKSGTPKSTPTRNPAKLAVEHKTLNGSRQPLLATNSLPLAIKLPDRERDKNSYQNSGDTNGNSPVNTVTPDSDEDSADPAEIVVDTVTEQDPNTTAVDIPSPRATTFNDSASVMRRQAQAQSNQQTPVAQQLMDLPDAAPWTVERARAGLQRDSQPGSMRNFLVSVSVSRPQDRQFQDPAAEDAPGICPSVTAERVGPIQKFKKYCQQLRDECGPYYPVDLVLVNGSASVRRLPPLETLPSMWTPIVRRGRSLCCGGKELWFPALRNLNARFPAGKMTLLLGEPGSGKTTLLKMLGGQFNSDRDWKVEGLYYNDFPASKSPLHPGLCFSFVPETDLHHIPTMTVRDTLNFAYHCKAQHWKSSSKLDEQHVDNLLEALGLTHVAKNIVGNDVIRGVSGGERRRVTIGEMWVSNVRVLLADHMTDGLDSATTIDIINAIRIWCKLLKTTVVMTLLQPPPEVYRCFDNVCVLRKGEIIFSGPVVDAAEYFTNLGYDRPVHAAMTSESILNPPTATPIATPSFRQTLQNSLQMLPFQRVLARRRNNNQQSSPPTVPTIVTGLPPPMFSLPNGHGGCALGGVVGGCAGTGSGEGFGPAPTPIGVNSPVDIRTLPPPQQFSGREMLESQFARPWLMHFWLCLKRQFWLEHTNVGLIVSRIVINLCTGLLTGSLWQNTPHTRAGLDTHNALVFHACMSIVLSVAPEMGVLMNERSVFYKQRDANFYRTSAYWIANNFFRVFFWGFVESGLFCIPLYWMSGFLKDMGHFFFFWFGLYLLNITSAVLFKLMVVICPTLAMAQTWAGLLQLIFFLFSGYLIPWNDVPAGWKWFTWCSPQSYAYAALAINQFENQLYQCNASIPLTNCSYSGNEFLSFHDLNRIGAGVNLGILVVWFAGWFFLGMFVLRVVRHKQRKVFVHAPPAEQRETVRLMQPSPTTLSWHNITYTVKNRKEEKQLLQSVTGYARPGTLTALMGPSGAGKTTLLDVLAGRVNSGKIAGDIRVDGHPKDQHNFSRICGYVEQLDHHSPKCTVKESLEFSGQLRLPENTPEKDRQALAHSLISMLGLAAVQHERIKDITTDQRKRVSIGVELMANPSILFLDEPTTGLDSLGAHTVMLVIRNVCTELGISVVCTIHQPSTELFAMFDNLLLLHHSGQPIYFGPVGANGSDIVSYFEAIEGVHKIRPGMNPATWMLEEIGGGVYSTPEKGDRLAAAFDAHPLKQKLLDELAEEDRASRQTQPAPPTSFYAVSYAKQMKCVLYRCMCVYWRSPSYNLVRVLLIVVFAVIFGTVYWRLKWTQPGIFLRLSWCYTTTFYLGLMFIVSGLSVHIAERGVFNREQSSCAYAPWVYGLCYQIAEIPYVAAITAIFLATVWFLSDMNGKDRGEASDSIWFFKHLLSLWLFTSMCTYLGQCIARLSPMVEVGNAIGTGMANWMSSFAGFYLPRTVIPTGYLWLYWLNPLRFTYESMVVSLFDNRQISCTAQDLNITGPCLDGNGVLAKLGMERSLWWIDQLAVLAYTIAFMIASLVVLKFLRFGTR